MRGSACYILQGPPQIISRFLVQMTLGKTRAEQKSDVKDKNKSFPRGLIATEGP